MNDRATKSVILARVSTEDQEKGYSIDAQLNRLEDYCERNKLKILDKFQITESSTKGDRDKFYKMVKFAEKFAKKFKEPIAIVADKIDRAQRSFNEMPVLDKLRKDGLIELHFNTDNCVIHKDSPANEIFMWNISIALAQNYTDSLRDNVKRSIAQKLKQGEWISKAPIGYMHIKNEFTGKSDIVPDPYRAHLVRKLFEYYAKGIHSFAEIAEFAKRIGLTNSRGNKGYLSKSHVEMILKDPFYCGIMRVKKTGKEYPHRYDTVISQELFDKCMQVKKGRNRYVGYYNTKEFLFKGILKCAVTGRFVTTEQKSKTMKNGNKHTWKYLCTWKPEDPDRKMWFREDVIIEQVKEALQSIAIPNEKMLKEVITYIHKTLKNKQHSHRIETADLKREHTTIEEKIDRLVELMVEGKIEDEDYKRKHAKYRNELSEISKKLEILNQGDNKFANHLEYLVKVAYGAADYFTGSDMKKQKEIIKYVFQNLSLRGKKLEYTMAYPFSEFQKCSKNGEWWGMRDLNPRPRRYERPALTTELIPHFGLVLLQVWVIFIKCLMSSAEFNF